MKVNFSIYIDDISTDMKKVSLQLSCSSRDSAELEKAFRERDIPFIRRFGTFYPFQNDIVGCYENIKGHSVDEIRKAADTLSSIGFDCVCELWLENGKRFSELLDATINITKEHTEDSAPRMGK